jgi:hypothetical protein
MFEELHWEIHRMDCTQKYMHSTAKYIFDNERLPDKSIINIIKNSNAQETLSSNG